MILQNSVPPQGKVLFYPFVLIFILLPWLSDTATAQQLPQFEQVTVESFSRKSLFSSERLKIDGYLFKAVGNGKSPGAVLVPACGGLLNIGKQIRPWYRRMAVHLKRLGITSLLIDGFNPRGRLEICTQRRRDRTIDTDTRIQDSLAGLRFLRARGDIDASRVFLLTWGATGSLETMSRENSQVEELGGGFTASVMFYPSCNSVNRPYSSYAPIKMLIGEKDNWNPPAPCLELAGDKGNKSAPVTVKIFPDAYHGFDTPQPIHEMHNVAVSESVTVGGNPQSRTEAYQEITAFLTAFLASPTADNRTVDGKSKVK